MLRWIGAKLACSFTTAGLAERQMPVPLQILPDTLGTVLDPALAHCPDDIALSDAHLRLSFRELDAAVDRAAALLERLGTSPGKRVACSLPNCCAIVILFLACQRIGAIWVGINRVLPTSTKARILEHAGASLFMGDAAAIGEIAPHRTSLPDLMECLVVDEAGTWLAQPPLPFLRRTIAADDIAAINYTSGTTGEPKGILHSQNTMMTAAKVMAANGLLGAGLRRGVVLPLTITNVMIIAPLLSFLSLSSCHIAPVAKGPALARWLEENQIEALSAVPAMIYDLAHGQHPVSSLKVLISGGAALSPASAARLRERLGITPINTYGLTEAPTVVAQSGGHGPAPEGASGVPLPHIAITIRDDAGRQLPPGETGEICIASVDKGPWAGLYRLPPGYWRDEQRSADLSSRPWLRTGDIGYLDGHQWLYVTDRLADLILRGGSNVYPQEIVNVLEADPRVAAAAIVGVPDERMGEKTFAFVAPSDAEPTSDTLIPDLQFRCKAALPAYKWPDFWHILADFPRNPGGKIVLADLRRLALTLI